MIMKLSFILILIFTISNHSFAQCQTWKHIENKDKVQDSYTLYRDYFRREDYKKSFPYWEIVYKNAPATNGRIGFVYRDGRVFYFEKFKNVRSKSKKKKFAKIIMRLYREEQNCFPQSKPTSPPQEVIDFLQKN